MINKKKWYCVNPGPLRLREANGDKRPLQLRLQLYRKKATTTTKNAQRGFLQSYLPVSTFPLALRSVIAENGANGMLKVLNLPPFVFISPHFTFRRNREVVCQRSETKNTTPFRPAPFLQILSSTKWRAGHTNCKGTDNGRRTRSFVVDSTFTRGLQVILCSLAQRF